MSTPLTGLSAFGEDMGTLWTNSGPDSGQISLAVLWKRPDWLKEIKSLVGEDRRLVWFVDDERANRNWFVENHRLHFALLTFSCRKAVAEALRMGMPCDAVVTDVFFPADMPKDDTQAKQLLGIYEEMHASRVSDLPSVWDRWKHAWKLDGFSIAEDVALKAAYLNLRVPVLLFSRKATLLLSVDDWLGQPRSTLENTYWMLEKVNPQDPADSARRVADIQRERINAVIRTRGLFSGRKVFIGHGRSPIWLVLKDFLTHRLHLECDHFNEEPSTGVLTGERLRQMLDEARFAFLVMTAEDKRIDKTTQAETDHARENVIHEIGLFQGRLGIERAIVLREQHCEDFSNIHGLTSLVFPIDNIAACFEGIRLVLEREHIIER
jgi:hypothetical protein